METFKDILTRQVDTLQTYFDTCAGTLAAHKAETHKLENGAGDFDSSDEELDETLRAHDKEHHYHNHMLPREFAVICLFFRML